MRTQNSEFSEYLWLVVGIFRTVSGETETFMNKDGGKEPA